MKYPYQIYNLTSLPGERWKDVPDFEGYYQVSNRGRVKSVDRYVNHKSGIQQLVKGQILKQTIYKYYNKTVKDHMIALRVAFSKDNKRFDFQVRRLVYQAFKGSIPQGMNVVNKNGDGFNNMLSNLQMISTPEKQNRSIKRGRQIPSLKYLDRAKFKKTFGGYSRRKPIIQTDSDGKFTKTYPSIKAAARETGFDEKAIINCAKGRWKQYNGFRWEYAKINQDKQDKLQSTKLH